MKRQFLFLISGVLALTLAACAGSETDTPTEGGTTETPTGTGEEGDVVYVQVDGSSTVFPISEAMAEEFMAANPNVRITVGVSGSGGGFKKFCAGETDISNASRPIKGSEIELCEEAGIEFVEIPVAFDGVSVVVNPENDWAECLKPEELGEMWEPDAEGQIESWNQIKAEFPDRELHLYGPGTDSGTYDYFTEAVTGEEGESRGDFTASEDDNVIVQGVQSDTGGLGFFGFAYYEENKDTLAVVSIENQAGECIVPSEEAIADGTYNPLARPIFFYVNTASMAETPAVADFAAYQVDPANSGLISEVGYVPLPEDLIAKVQTRLQDGVTGTIFENHSSLGVKLSDKL